jgi:catechol 2,3-dioxygenase-like lactoylglutathione lyase family enzyme
MATLIVLGAFGASAPLGAQVIDAKFELFVTDPAEAIHFYEALGFEVAHQKQDGYSTLQSPGTVVALSPVPWWLPLRLARFLRYPPIGTELVFYTDRLEALHGELVEAGYDPGSIALQSWGDRDFRVTDPDGYYVRLSEGRAIPAE